MVELTKLLKSVSGGKTALEELNTLNEKFQKEQQKKMAASMQPATALDQRSQLLMDIDYIKRQQADLAIQVNNLHRLYVALEKKSAPWNDRLLREREHRVQYLEADTEWYHQTRLVRNLASDVIAKSDAPAIQLGDKALPWSDILPAPSAGVHVLVHSVVNTEGETKSLLECEQNIPYFHDLCITTTMLNDHDLCHQFEKIQKIQNLTVRKVDGNTTTLASLLGIFAREVANHEILLNIDFQQLANVEERRIYIGSLCGSEKRVEQIFTLFQSTENVGLFYVRDLRKKQDPFEFTFEDFPEAEKKFSTLGIPFHDAIFSCPREACFWCKTEIFRPILGNRWTHPAKEETKEETKQREHKERQEDQEAYQMILGENQEWLTRSIGYLCDLKRYRQCVTAPGSDYIYGTVQKEIRNQFAFENLGAIGLEKFDIICFSVRDTLIVSCGDKEYCARNDLRILYHYLQNKGVSIIIFNDLGEDAIKALQDCGFDQWDYLTDRVDLIPKWNTCLICAHRIEKKNRINQLIILSPDRLLSLVGTKMMNKVSEYSDGNRNIIVSKGLFNSASALSNPEMFFERCKRYAAALLFKGFIEAAEQHISENAVVLTIGEEGDFLKRLWEVHTGRKAFYLPVTENLLFQASIHDRETFMGMVDRPFDGTLKEFLEKRFNITVREPYQDIYVEIPEQRKKLRKILDPVSDDIIKQMRKQSRLCSELVDKAAPSSDRYVLLSLHPSARTRYELANILNATVTVEDFYSLQKTQWKENKENEYVQPFPYCVDILKTTTHVEDDRQEDTVNSHVELQETDGYEQGDRITKAQKELLRTIKKLKDCRLESIADYYALGETLMQSHLSERE